MKLVVLAVVLLVLLALPVVAFPTYTARDGETDGTYGNTSIPVVYYDETGIQLFDGNYGKSEWMYSRPVNSDYYQRYDEQNGYALPWVGWQYPPDPLVTFDMGDLYTFSQIGIHGYRLPQSGIHLPDELVVEFGDDGSNYDRSVSQKFITSDWNSDHVYWLSFSFEPVTARYAKIHVVRYTWPWTLLDEVSINGKDGLGNPVPEPSGLLALCGGVAGLLAFRRRR